jgi:hypothetical protein
MGFSDTIDKKYPSEYRVQAHRHRRQILFRASPSLKSSSTFMGDDDNPGEGALLELDDMPEGGSRMNPSGTVSPLFLILASFNVMRK